MSTAYWYDVLAWIVNGFATDSMAAIGSILIANFTTRGDQAVANGK
jgi:hypothetical protein